MYSKIVRDDKYKLRIIDFIKNEYGINAKYFIAAKRGFYGETWKLSAGSADYFIKIVYCNEHKTTYEKSFSVVQRLNDFGIDYISQIVKTKTGDLFSRFDGAVMGVFNWIEGENVETDATKPFEYQMLAKVYTTPCEGLGIEEEDFSNKCADEFFGLWSNLEDKKILLLLETNRKILEHRAARLNLFSGLNKEDKSGFVITHGDAGGNFLVSGDKNYIVDWDGATFAPPERDAWVMCSHDWARELFQKALHENGIAYKLRSERLAYYCYRFFFFYLNSFLYANSETEAIAEYIDCWIKDSIQWADTFSTFS